MSRNLSSSTGEKYASLKHFPKEADPRPPSDYAGGYLEWDENLHRHNDEADATVRTDLQIEAAVRGALSSDDHFDLTQIDVQVIKGVVLLTGNVREATIKESAERRIGKIPGIREIKNQLSLHLR